MLVCVSPVVQSAEESWCSLNFAARVRTVELGKVREGTNLHFLFHRSTSCCRTAVGTVYSIVWGGAVKTVRSSSDGSKPLPAVAERSISTSYSTQRPGTSGSET